MCCLVLLNWETDFYTPPVPRGASLLTVQHQQCIKIVLPKDPELYAPLALNVKKGSTSQHWSCVKISLPSRAVGELWAADPSKCPRGHEAKAPLWGHNPRLVARHQQNHRPKTQDSRHFGNSTLERPPFHDQSIWQFPRGTKRSTAVCIDSCNQNKAK